MKSDPSRIIGHDSSLRKVMRYLPALATVGSHIVITGEAGTGKTLVARCIHALRPGDAELSILNAATLSERDLRLNVFGADLETGGHEWVGALERPGNHLLKHIDNAPAHLQDALSEAISRGTTRRSQRGDPRPVSCRIFFTLERPPERLVEEGRITRTLYHTLACLPALTVPPLRSRRKDIGAFVDQYISADGSVIYPAEEYRKRLRGFLLRQDWRENITELKAYLRTLVPKSFEEAWEALEHREIERVIMLIEEESEFSLQQSISAIETNLVNRALEQTEGHRTRAARLLGMHPYALSLRVRSGSVSV